MTTDTEVKPLTADEAKEAFASLPESVPQRIYEGLSRIATRDHGTYDTATHAAVPHEELERLRADARRLDWMERRLLSVEKFEFDGIRSVWELQPLRDDGFTCSDEKVIKAGLRDAIDAAQQEEGHEM